MQQIMTVLRMTLREVVRRRSVLLTLLALPLAFYLARHEVAGQATRMLVLGLGWAIATLTLFTTVGALALDRRLRVAGYRTRALVAGRLIAMAATGAVLGAAYLVLVAVDQDFGRLWAVALMMACAVVIGPLLGMAVGLVVRRELEGALALLTILATQMIADPDGGLAKALPFWSVRQLATYAIDGQDSSYLSSGVLHAVATAAMLALLCAVLSALRLRLYPPDRHLLGSAEPIAASRELR